MDNYERLQALLAKIRDSYCSGVNAKLARTLGKDQTYINRLFYARDKKGAKGIGQEIMDVCREKFKLPRGFWEMDPAEVSLGLGSETADLLSDAMTTQPKKQDYEPLIDVEHAIELIANMLENTNDVGRKMVEPVLLRLLSNPETHATAAETLRFAAKTQPISPDPSPTPTPGARKSKAKNAPLRTKDTPATLTVKIGGGQKQQYDLPLRTVADPFDARQATAQERKYYDRVKAAPKARG